MQVPERLSELRIHAYAATERESEEDLDLGQMDNLGEALDKEC